MAGVGGGGGGGGAEVTGRGAGRGAESLEIVSLSDSFSSAGFTNSLMVRVIDEGEFVRTKENTLFGTKSDRYSFNLYQITRFLSDIYL